jgi:hypothetical protein
MDRIQAYNLNPRPHPSLARFTWNAFFAQQEQELACVIAHRLLQNVLEPHSSAVFPKSALAEQLFALPLLWR